MAFHYKNGWHFERIIEPNPEKYGWVRIFHINAETPEGDRNIDVEIEIEPHSWASVVASVCPEGETAFTFGLAKAIHGVLDYMK